MILEVISWNTNVENLHNAIEKPAQIRLLLESFLIKLQVSGPQETPRDSNAGVFLLNLQHF